MILAQVMCVIAAAFTAAFGWGIARRMSRVVAESRARKRREEVRLHIELERRAHCRTRLP
jgi:hypothetical protein